MSFNFAPKYWAMCNGQLLPINQNQALYSLLGTTYGGDGRVNFALPDLRARVPIHAGNGHVAGERAGASSHALTLNEIPSHSHMISASASTGNSQFPNFGGTGHVLAAEPGNLYSPSTSSGAIALHGDSVSRIGSAQAHPNMQPYLTVTYCIALAGIFPSQN